MSDIVQRSQSRLSFRFPLRQSCYVSTPTTTVALQVCIMTTLVCSQVPNNGVCVLQSLELWSLELLCCHEAGRGLIVSVTVVDLDAHLDWHCLLFALIECLTSLHSQSAVAFIKAKGEFSPLALCYYRLTLLGSATIIGVCATGATGELLKRLACTIARLSSAVKISS